MNGFETPLELGIDIEETFQIFGEGFIYTNMGLEEEAYELAERKAGRVRDAMLDLGCPTSMVQRFEAAASRIIRSGDPLPRGGPKKLRRMVDETADELGRLMGEVRGVLLDEDGEVFDVGVMLARLSLCLRALSVPPTPTLAEYRQLYQTELERVVPIIASMIETVRRRPSWNEVPGPELRRSVTELAGQLARWDGGSDEWCRTARVKTDEVFASFGAVGKMMASTPDTEEASPSTGEDVLTQLRELRVRVYQLVQARDLDNAEKGQRLLIEDCRRILGPFHELTLAVRNDLALTLLYQGRGDLAADWSYDVSTDAETALGERAPATAREAVRTLFILMATKGPEENLQFFRKLDWLVQASPDSLDPELVATRQELLKLMGQG